MLFEPTLPTSDRRDIYLALFVRSNTPYNPLCVRQFCMSKAETHAFYATRVGSRSDNSKMVSPNALRIPIVKWIKCVLNGKFSCVSTVFFVVLVIFLFKVVFTVKYTPIVLAPLEKAHVDWNELENNSVNNSLIEHKDGHVYTTFKTKYSPKLVSDVINGRLTIERPVIPLASLRKQSNDDSHVVEDEVDNKQFKTLVDRDVELARSAESDPNAIPGFKYPLTILKDPYNINCPSVCSKLKLMSTIVLVHSSTTHFLRRSSIRQTWANYRVYKGLSLRIVFLLGMPQETTTQTLIEHESSVHGDIVQGKFVDTYHNLTHKGVLGLRWVTEHCKQAKFVLKVDDDVFVNVFKLMEKIDIYFKNKTRHIWCHVRINGTSPIERKTGKWMVEDDEFRNLIYYPFTHCHGFFIVISSDIIHEMYQASKVTTFFWIDDVYLFGLLPFKIGNVSHSHIVNMSIDEDKSKTCFDNKAKQCDLLVANAHSEGTMDTFWNSVVNQTDKNLVKRYSNNNLVL